MRTKPLALVLDDDELFRKMMEKVLERLGFQALTVETVEEFEERDAQWKPDVYLIDLKVGNARGIDLVERLRAGKSEAPILVISGERDEAVVAHALELGANDFIRKPFNRTLLAAKLGQVVRTVEIEDAERLLEWNDRTISEARILFDTEIVSVDELGFQLRSPHLLPKGSVVRIGGPIVAEVGGAPDCLICVTSTALLPGGGYDIHAEFESTNLEFLQSVRRWLAKNPVAKAA